MADNLGSFQFDTRMDGQRALLDDIFRDASRELKRREKTEHEKFVDYAEKQTKWIVPHSQTYAGVFNWYQKYYYNYFDESLIDSQENSLAMRHDGFIQELLYHRQIPTVVQDFSFECDDPDDPGQVKIRKQLHSVVNNISYFKQLLLQLLEAIYYGKSGSQFLWGKKRIRGREFWTVLQHDPVQGDKIVYRYNGTPGVMIYAGSISNLEPALRPFIMNIDKGPALFFDDQKVRDRFIIHNFHRSDTDYLYESDKALGIQGLGLRDRFYWMWNMRAELIGWMLDALQRVGANGMLYGYYQAGNPEARDATLDALRNLVKENVAAFPTSMGATIDDIRNIQTNGIGYDVIYNIIVHLEGIMRRGFLGQNLSSQSAATGLGSGVADLQGDMFQNIILYDSSCLGETIDDQLVKKILKFNKWKYKGRWYYGDDLPFNVKFKFNVNKNNVQAIIQAAQTLYNMGVPLDMENLRDLAGLAAPRNSATTLVMPGGSNGQGDNSRAVQNETEKDSQRPRTEREPKVKNPEQTDRNRLELFDKGYAGSDPGVFVSLWLDDATAREISYPDSEDLHCTVLYLGRLSEIGTEGAEIARQTVKLLAGARDPLIGTIGGIGRFSASGSSDGKDVVYCGVDLPELPSFYSELCHVLKIAGIEWRKDHGFTPHITLRYIDQNEGNPNRKIPNIPVSFNHVTFSIGEYKEQFPFGMTDDDYEFFDRHPCGDGPDGFEENNTCQKGGSRSPDSQSSQKPSHPSETAKQNIASEKQQEADQAKPKTPAELAEHRSKVIDRMAATAKKYGFSVVKEGRALLDHLKGDEKAVKGTIASFYPSRNAIIFNEDNEYYNDSASAMKRFHASGWMSTDNPDHAVIHEMGHAFHFKNVNDKDRWKEIRATPIPEDIRGAIKKEVSTYATTNPLEVVAEMFTGMSSGKKYSRPLIEYYKSLSGPPPLKQEVQQ